jgi:DNA polymerase III alpha subunit
MYCYYMITDKFGQFIYSENELIDVYMTDPDTTLKRVFVSEPIQFDTRLNLKNTPEMIQYLTSDQSITEFDQEKQSIWFIPDDYKNFDIAKFVLDQCSTEAELQRAGEELLLYQERDMFILLRYLKYLVDTMRANNLVWGVGRGSSVASFVLFLIGVHKINSLFYQLDVNEFLK